MVDLSAFASALASLKAAKDIAEAMVGLRDATAFQGKLIKFQSKIIDANNSAFAAQDERFALLEKIRELEKKVADFEAWDTEKQRYQMEKVWAGSIAYVLTEDARGTEPIHWLCAKCYQDRKKSILQFDKFEGAGYMAIYTCPTCSASIRAKSPS
jgi:hypothetical protein